MPGFFRISNCTPPPCVFFPEATIKVYTWIFCSEATIKIYTYIFGRFPIAPPPWAFSLKPLWKSIPGFFLWFRIAPPLVFFFSEATIKVYAWIFVWSHYKSVYLDFFCWSHYKSLYLNFLKGGARPPPPPLDPPLTPIPSSNKDGTCNLIKLMHIF